MLLRLFFTSFLIMSFTAMSNAQSPQLSPRQKYIIDFNFQWDLISDRKAAIDPPFFGTYDFLAPAKIYNCGVPLNDFEDCHIEKGNKNWFYFYEPSDPDEIRNLPWFDIRPYTEIELQNLKIYWAVVLMCNGAFNMFDTIFLPEQDPDAGRIGDEIEKDQNFTKKIFTERFLEYIGAPEELKKEIRSVGILTKEANHLFREAWIQKKISRPAIALAMGECGAGEIPVEIEFKEPTKRMQYITEFDFYICSQYAVDPWNIDQCPYVMEHTREEQFLAGYYRIRLLRASGRIDIIRVEVEGEADSRLKL